jgi:glucose/arabinose dehydrogenase
MLDDVITTGDQGLLALAADPEFARNGYVYAAYSGEQGLRLTRFRAIGNRLYDRVVLMESAAAPAVSPSTALRFGPDRHLYWGIDDGGDAAAGGDLGTFSGKVLRLNRDATTPADQAGATPVYARSMRAPRSMDWGADGAMWVLDARPRASGAVVNVVVRETEAGQRGAIVARYGFPAGVLPQDLVVYVGDAIPAFRGDLFVADDGASSLVRLRLGGQARRTIVATERLLDGRIMGARAVAVGMDGALYLATGDAVVRLASAPR